MKLNKIDQTTLTLKEVSQQHLQHIKSFQWNISTEKDDEGDDNNSKVYTYFDDKTLVTTYKATQDFIPKHYNNTVLDHFRASLSTIELREKWCPWLKNIRLIDKFESNVTSLQGNIIDHENSKHDTVWLEQTSCNKYSVQLIAASCALDFFMAIEIENRFDNTHTACATIYLQWARATLVTPSATLTRLIQLEPHPWISQCDPAITIQKLHYESNGECCIHYTYQQQQQDIDQLPNAAVDIHQKTNHHGRWQSGSWDQKQQQQYQQQTIRKNKFLTSPSLLFTSSSANSSPQLHPITANSSYPDKQHNSMIMPWLAGDDEEDEENAITSTYKLDKDELRIQVAYIPRITIALPERIEWSDKFAQLCVRCYRLPPLLQQQSDNGYIIQILHPQKIMQYFIEEEESMRLDDDQDIDPILVDISMSKSDHQKLIINKNEQSIRTWLLGNDDEDEEKEDEDLGNDKRKEQEDIFVDEMEELIEESTINTNNLQTIASSLPTRSTLIQTVPELKKERESIVNNAALPAIHSLTKEINNMSTTADVKQQQKLTADTNKTVIPELNNNQPKEIKPIDPVDEYKLLETKIPLSDPAALQKIFPQFNEYLQPSATAAIVQAPSKENGYVIIKKIDVANHPLGGGFLSESIWKNSSIWDIKAVLESTGARKMWDNTFENSVYLHALTPTSSLWHTKMKGTWPVSPRDYVCFQGQYTSPYRIDLLSTSCIGDSFQYKPLPQPVTGYTRATMDVMGWRLEQIDDQTTSVKQVLVTQFPSWVIHFITSRFIVQTCAAVQSAREYFETFGAPPSLEHLTCAQLVNVKHDHERKNWRCEYTRRLSISEKDTQEPNNHNQNSTITGSINSTSSSSLQSTISVVRLDQRRWAADNKYVIVIDPPPSRVSALQKACDPYGVWLTVEHDEAFIIPLRGKILVLIKPDEITVTVKSHLQNKCTLNVNGNAVTIEKEEPEPCFSMPDKDKKVANLSKQEEHKAESNTTVSNVNPSPSTAPIAVDNKNSSVNVMTEEAKINQILDQLPTTPKEHAQAALSFLRLTDEQFGWTVLSDNNKSGMRISKKPGAKNTSSGSKAEGSNVDKPDVNSVLQVYDPYVVYKGSKVIENFSVDEIRSVITDIGPIRALYDDTIESKTDLIQQYDESGCRVIRQSVKALFPFKNREIYAVSCLAQEELTSMSNTKRTLYVESSLPDFPLINSKKTRGHLFMSGWILEPIDPYNTTTANHPIPSTRVIYVAALDLGASVPSYISNLVVNNWFPKKIQAVESFLKSKGPPPVIVQPFPLLIFSNNTLSKVIQDNVEWTCVHSTYDETHHFKVTSRLRILSEQKKSLLEDAQPTASSSTSLVPPFRRPSNHTLTSETRRGSLPTNALPKKRTTASPSTTTSTTGIQPNPAASASSSTTMTAMAANPATAYKTLTCLQATFDLRLYTKGYEIQAQLYQITNNKQQKNVSNKLELCVSEPPLSNLLNGNKKKMKHTVTINVQGLSASNLYELDFSLYPVRQETLNNRATQLTVSHVLGEDQVDDGTWRGVILVNGVEANVNSDIKLKTLHEEKVDGSNSNISSNSSSGSGGSGNGNNGRGVRSMDVTSPIKDSGSTDGVESVGGLDSLGEQQQNLQQPFFEKTACAQEDTRMPAPYIGGSVVAAALGNVSAGVNNFGARMMNPFRAASNSFLLSNNNSAISEQVPSQDLLPSSDEDEENYRTSKRFTREERNKINSTAMTMHEIRLLRKSSDTMRKGVLLLLICIGLAIVFALLMLQPMLERYYASFTVSSTVASLNSSIENGVVRRLIQIPWFGGWDIQLIAIRRT